jgi:hypothetical protein
LHRAQYGLALGRSDHEYWDSIENTIREAGSRVDSNDELLNAADGFLKIARSLFS